MRQNMKYFTLTAATLTVFWPLLTAKSAEGDAGKKPAVIVVRLPAGAELVIGGMKSKQQSAVREFDTPPLPPGQKFSYAVKAAWKDGDKEEKRETTIVVQAGETKHINLLEMKTLLPLIEKIPPPMLVPEPEEKPQLVPEPELKLLPEIKTEPKPVKQGTLALRMPEILNLQPGGTKLLPIKVVRTDFQGPVNIKFEGLPPDVELKDVTIAADKQKVYVLAVVPARAEEKEWHVKVIGLCGPICQDCSLKIKIAK